ncbi:MAG: hypothetical protein R3F49_21015 [Planctomycetota bacterium]
MKHTQSAATLFALGLLAPLALLACGRAESAVLSSQGDEARAPEPEPLAALVDAPLAAQRKRLLELSFEAASKMPSAPHVKNRSRAQEGVVSAVLRLGQARQALEASAQIDNWRRGTAYAALALHEAAAGHAAAARRCLALAQEVHAEALEQDEQEWRADRLLARISQVKWALGDIEGALALEREIDAAELADLVAAKARDAAAEDYEAQFAELERLVGTGDFNLTRNALAVGAALHDRFYDNEARRAQLEAWITTAWKPLPIDLRIDLVERIVANAEARGDAARGREMTALVAQLADQVSWTPELRIAVQARLAKLLLRVGQSELALQRLGAALDLFSAERERIFDVFRAGALRPVAEAYAAAGQTDAALSVFRLAVEEGALNPNSRPKAEDLAATCCALAESGLVLDDEFMARMEAISNGLAAPW